MNKKIIQELYENRLLSSNEEFERFENSLNKMAEVIKEDDIFELCKVFDDNTRDDEMMFGLIHLIETFSSEKAFENTVLGVVNMMETAMNWAKIIIYRCLNDDFSKDMLKNAIIKADYQVNQSIVSLLYVIKQEDGEKFGSAIDYILN
ncbi:MAG: hypothetical protein IJD58_12905 [Lachnospiraceae bacterium]|nr:hypothetical protein [Lachnospiraceae bacterium]